MRRLNTIKGIKEWWGWNVDIEIDFTKPWSIEAFQSAWWFISWLDQWIEYPLKITDEWITIDYAWVLSDDASIAFSIWLSWVSEVEVQFDPAVTWHKFNSINITNSSSYASVLSTWCTLYNDTWYFWRSVMMYNDDWWITIQNFEWETTPLLWKVKMSYKSWDNKVYIYDNQYETEYPFNFNSVNVSWSVDWNHPVIEKLIIKAS